jgi:hypothetical protein
VPSLLSDPQGASIGRQRRQTVKHLHIQGQLSPFSHQLWLLNLHRLKSEAGTSTLQMRCLTIPIVGVRSPIWLAGLPLWAADLTVRASLGIALSSARAASRTYRAIDGTACDPMAQLCSFSRHRSKFPQAELGFHCASIAVGLFLPDAELVHAQRGAV